MHPSAAQAPRSREKLEQEVLTWESEVPFFTDTLKFTVSTVIPTGFLSQVAKTFDGLRFV